MKGLAVLISVLAVASAEWIDIDWSQVRPIEEFDHYWTRLPPKLQSLRDSQPDRRIVNGREAIPGQFPYQVAILGNFPLGVGLCGATVLTNNYILTAAHCLQDSAGGVAIFGAHNRLIDEPTQQRIPYTVDGMHIHPGYTLVNVRNDIGTVRLESPVTFTDRIQPARLPGHSDGRTFAGMTGTISGWGRTSNDHSILSDVLKYTNNPILTNADCLAAWENMVELIQDQNVCLSSAGGRTACNSDSGGPLTVTYGDQSLQVGIVSFGSVHGCTDQAPTVYARITYYLKWIEENSDFVADN